ncbi:MAG: pseudouridine synthase [Pseudomonadales bacterium]|nr:pseudouridine synthase [Pseudomonadales bacterium]
MKAKQARLDRFIRRQLNLPQRDVQLLLARGQVCVDKNVVNNGQMIINEFSHIVVNDQVLQALTPKYVMLNKPKGVVSATKDPQHKTVVDLLGPGDHADLHIAGRLDFNSTGLLLLTNDGRWSRYLASPENNISKRYRVTVEKPLNEDYVNAFSEGLFFAYEGITTRPAKLEIINDYEAEINLTEGRYHQIKRMFGRFQNKVLALHRLAIGPLALDTNLAEEQHRALSEQEVANMLHHSE